MKKSVCCPFWNLFASFGRSLTCCITYTSYVRDLPTETKIPKILSGLVNNPNVHQSMTLKARLVDIWIKRKRGGELWGFLFQLNDLKRRQYRRYGKLEIVRMGQKAAKADERGCVGKT